MHLQGCRRGPACRIAHAIQDSCFAMPESRRYVSHERRVGTCNTSRSYASRSRIRSWRTMQRYHGKFRVRQTREHINVCTGNLGCDFLHNRCLQASEDALSTQSTLHTSSRRSSLRRNRCAHLNAMQTLAPSRPVRPHPQLILVHGRVSPDPVQPLFLGLATCIHLSSQYQYTQYLFIATRLVGARRERDPNEALHVSPHLGCVVQALLVCVVYFHHLVSGSSAIEDLLR